MSRELSPELRECYLGMMSDTLRILNLVSLPDDIQDEVRSALTYVLNLLRTQP